MLVTENKDGNMLQRKRQDSPRRINLQPSFWGPSAWKFLYTVALGYPQNPTPMEKQAAANLLESLHFLLPCSNCRQNVWRELENMPYDKALNNSDSFTHYVYTLESKVTQRLGKRDVVSYADRLLQIYHDTPASENAMKKNALDAYYQQHAAKAGPSLQSQKPTPGFQTPPPPSFTASGQADDGQADGDDNKGTTCPVSLGWFIVLLTVAALAGALVGWGITYGVLKPRLHK